jgi:hypothetical protein
MISYDLNIDFIIGAFVETVSQSTIARVRLEQVTAFLSIIYPRYLKCHRLLKRMINEKSEWPFRKSLPLAMLGFVAPRSMVSKDRWGPLYWFVLYDMANEAKKMGPTHEFAQFFLTVLPLILPCSMCTSNMLKWLNRKDVWNLEPVEMVFGLHDSVHIENTGKSMPLKSEGVRFFSEDRVWASTIKDWLCQSVQ